MSTNTTTGMPILAYWDIRGLAAPIRLLLEYAGTPYENRVMIMPKPEWLEYKKSLGFDFPNLPCYQVRNSTTEQQLTYLPGRGPEADAERCHLETRGEEEQPGRKD